jgi:competence protein ComEA
MSDLKMLTQAQQAERRLMRLIPLVLALMLVTVLWVAGMIMASQRTLDQQTMGIQSPQYLVNLNSDGEGELMLLPGVGKTIAGRIIAYRTEQGPFTSINQLTKISGISDKTLNRLRAFLLPLADDQTQK